MEHCVRHFQAVPVCDICKYVCNENDCVIKTISICKYLEKRDKFDYVDIDSGDCMCMLASIYHKKCLNDLLVSRISRIY